MSQGQESCVSHLLGRLDVSIAGAVVAVKRLEERAGLSLRSAVPTPVPVAADRERNAASKLAFELEQSIAAVNALAAHVDSVTNRCDL